MHYASSVFSTYKTLAEFQSSILKFKSHQLMKLDQL